MSTSWKIDPTHSSIGFSARHMVFSKVRGTFGKFSSDVAYDAATPTQSTLNVTIDVASVDTGVADRDAHLRSKDFFDVDAFPSITFASKAIEGTGDSYRLLGDLTIHGTTKPVTLEVESLGAGKDPWGNQRRMFSAKTSIARSEYGLTWNQVLEAGGVLVSDTIDIDLEIQLVAPQA